MFSRNGSTDEIEAGYGTLGRHVW